MNRNGAARRQPSRPGDWDVFVIGDAAVLEWGFFGTHHQCVASLAKLDNPVKVRLPQKRLPAAGEQLALHVDPADLVLLTR